ncbi:protein RD3 [Exaiptasia diaphana]|uniref:Uncharacterized protein n=1 Tax=Exaiptasia diaphana TaxID=2652724 RepID=A0A913XM43_EXADI|nr:protein RD3 [Exaiptasia diaphana]
MLLSSFGSAKAPPTKPDSVVVCETLMGELEGQMKELERLRTVKESEEKRRKNEADYSWLMNTPRKNVYRLSPVDRLVLEELSSQVRPEDSGHVIKQFRTIVETHMLDLSEIPKVFRCVIERYLSESTGTAKDDTGLKWVTRSLSDFGTTLRTIRSHSSSKVYPVASTSAEDCDNRRTQSMPEFISMRNLPV